MQAIRAALPELDRARRDAIAAPVGRQWDFAVGIPRAQLVVPLFERLAAVDGLGLVRNRRADAAAEWARVEVLLGFQAIHARRAALDANLALQRRPVEHQRDSGILLDLAALAAPIVRVEHESLLVDALEQDDARRGRAVRRRRR